MAKEFYMRIRTAGRYKLIARYSRPLPGDSKPVKAAKQAATTTAQKYINIKNATERLQLLLCANFDSKEACFCTFTFTDETLPANRKHTKAIFTGYIRSLKKALSRDDRPFKYIYTIEGEPLTSCPAAAPVAGNRWEITPWREERRWEQLDTAAPDSAETTTRLHAHSSFFWGKRTMRPSEAFGPMGKCI